MIRIILWSIVSTRSWIKKWYIKIGWVEKQKNFLIYLERYNSPLMLLCYHYIVDYPLPDHVLFASKINNEYILLLIDWDLAYKTWHKISIMDQLMIIQLVDSVASLNPANTLYPLGFLDILIRNNQPLVDLIVCILVRIILFQVLWPVKLKSIY